MASTSGDAYIPIEPQHWTQFLDKAGALLKQVSWKPVLEKVKSPQAMGATGLRRSVVGLEQKEEILSLLASARRVSKDELLLTENANFVLNTVRKGLAVGMHLSALYTKFSGLESLSAMNDRGNLTEQQKTEFRAKYTTASAINVFVPAWFIVWELSRYKPEQANAIKLDFDGIPEVSLLGPTSALSCMMYYHAAYVEKSGVVNTDLDLLKMTLLYFQGIIDEIKMRKDSLQYTQFFTDKRYKLIDEDFAVRGFEASLGLEVTSVSFNHIQAEEIVGNVDAKHQAQRHAERVCCFSPKDGRNPMYDLGALPIITMGMGVPGTGKSLLIGFKATRIEEGCKRQNKPFLFWPFPDTPVSTFQGGSAERVTEWFRVLRDPSRIIYAPIDDAENSFEDRTRHGVSAGVREVIGVFLRNSEGAYAINDGHALIEFMTNLAEQIDRAVLSRVQVRMPIEGAKRFEDWMDQDYLWWRKYGQFDPNFVDMCDPKGYKFLEAQKKLRSLSELYANTKDPVNEIVQRIYEQVRQNHNPEKDHEFFARFYMGIKKEFPWFSSRDLRNIQRAVDDRIMDFDLPQEWWDQPELFYLQDYDTRRGMIVEHIKSNLKGLSFAQVRLQEAIRYIDAAVQIGQTDWERRLEARIGEYKLDTEARRQLSASAVK